MDNFYWFHLLRERHANEGFFGYLFQKITDLWQKGRFFQFWAIPMKTFDAKEPFYCILSDMTPFQFVTNRRSFRNFYQKWTLGCYCGKIVKKKLKYYPTSRGKNSNILILYAIDNENVAS